MPFLARAEKGNLSLGVVPIPLAQVLPDCTPRAKEEEKRLLAQICRAAAMVDRVFDENEVQRDASPERGRDGTSGGEVILKLP